MIGGDILGHGKGVTRERNGVTRLPGLPRASKSLRLHTVFVRDEWDQGTPPPDHTPPDLHVLLLEDLLVLLQKQDEKLLLKCHSKTAVGSSDSKQTFSPVLKLNAVLIRSVATDKRAFFIICTSKLGPPQIYELVALTSSDKNTVELDDSDVFHGEPEPEELPGGKGPELCSGSQHRLGVSMGTMGEAIRAQSVRDYCWGERCVLQLQERETWGPGRSKGFRCTYHDGIGRGDGILIESLCVK
ncbi:Rho guanine nucleotide exchange factor 11 [Saguinus oedipus]|uniref:Rho guanine nucleotide exchange factor 11 n=1 Tax=Saguinus oedipus TaxID=9490 RepID=A0ABQ9TI81_SAGOE|nr:Rho guanine nucleotide exchange factor 11 [Saguinus oedipus]